MGNKLNQVLLCHVGYLYVNKIPTILVKLDIIKGQHLFLKNGKHSQMQQYMFARVYMDLFVTLADYL